MRTFLAGWICVGVLLLSGCALPASRDTAASERLADHMVERLSIAREVAWSKAQSGAPVLDPEREAALLARLVGQGKTAGLDPVRVERFFVAQIAASRAVQTELLEAWTEGLIPRPHTMPLDLRTQIRPRMDAVSAALITSLAEFPDGVGRSYAKRIADVLRKGGFSDEVVALALSGL